MKVRGLVVIESEPQNATIYLDDKKKGAFATTPWSGSLDGEHKIIIEKRGYRPVETTIIGRPDEAVRARGGDVAGRLPRLDRDHVERRRAPTSSSTTRAIGAVGKTPLLAEHQARQAHVLGHAPRATTSTQDDDRRRAGRDAHGQGDRSRARRSAGSTSIGLGIEDSQIYVDGKVAVRARPVPQERARGRSHARR